MQNRSVRILVAGLLLACRLEAADSLTNGSAPQKSEQATFALMSPPAAQTAESIAVLWDKPVGIGVEGYEVYLDNALVATTSNADYTFRGLAAAKEAAS